MKPNPQAKAWWCGCLGVGGCTRERVARPPWMLGGMGTDRSTTASARNVSPTASRTQQF